MFLNIAIFHFQTEWLWIFKGKGEGSSIRKVLLFWKVKSNSAEFVKHGFWIAVDIQSKTCWKTAGNAKTAKSALYFHRIFAIRAQEMSRVKIIISNTSSPFFLAGSIIKIFWSIELYHMIDDNDITILSNNTNDDFVMMMTSLIINVNGQRAISWPFRRIAPWSDAHTMLLFVVIIIKIFITII